LKQKKREVAKLPARLIAAGDLRDAMLEHGERRDFLAALAPTAPGDIALIAEVKKASPSAGVICRISIRSASPGNTKPRGKLPVGPDG
jgi:indole-3-glycerol phosphate synthase